MPNKIRSFAKTTLRTVNSTQPEILGKLSLFLSLVLNHNKSTERFCYILVTTQRLTSELVLHIVIFIDEHSSGDL